MLTVAECERTIKKPGSAEAGWPSTQWPDNCHEVARAVKAAGLIEGESRYGLYHGPIAPTSEFGGRRFSRHGWIELEDGGIFDPTRWVFEDVNPYLFLCSGDAPEVEEYDVGASRIIGSTNSDPPEFSGESFPKKHPQFPTEVEDFLQSTFQTTEPCRMQLFWLVNQSPESLGELAEPIYQAFVDVGLKALIPMDFRQVVFGGEY